MLTLQTYFEAKAIAAEAELAAAVKFDDLRVKHFRMQLLAWGHLKTHCADVLKQVALKLEQVPVPVTLDDAIVATIQKRLQVLTAFEYGSLMLLEPLNREYSACIEALNVALWQTARERQ